MGAHPLNYRVVFAIVFIITSVAMVVLARSELVGRGLASILVMIPIAILLVATIRAFSKQVPREFDNHELEKRIEHFADMLGRARKSVVIVTGSLNQSFYTQPRVVRALRSLRPGVKVRVIYTAPHLDLGSSEFISLLKSKRAKLHHASGMRLKHAVIVDGRDTKLEEPVADTASEKVANYFYNRPAVAKRLLREIDGRDLPRADFPEGPSL